MGITYNSSTILNGLSLYLDAFNKRSYPGSGTAWYDLSGNGYHHTLYNSAGLTTANGAPCIDVSSSSKYIQKTSSTFTFGSSHTMVAWANPLSDAQVADWRTLFRTSSDHPLLIQDGTDDMGYWQGGFYSYGVKLSTLGIQNKWSMFTLSATGGVTTLYVNDTAVGNTARSASGQTHDYIGTYTNAQQFGYIATAMIYNRALSGNEVKQLYNTTKKRFFTDSQIKTYFPGPPPLVTDGLVMFVDASNLSSYSGSGSTWTDLQGNYNLTLYNSPTYSTINGGVGIFTFNGTNQNAKNSSINYASGTSTVISAVRLTGTSNQRTVAGVNNNWLLGTWGGYVNRYYAEGWVSTPTTVDTNWRIYAGTSDTAADNYKFYSNGIKLADNNGGSQGPNGISVGSWGNNQEYGACQVGFVMVYNRVLSDAEIVQVYDYFKNRYGLS